MIKIKKKMKIESISLRTLNYDKALMNGEGEYLQIFYKLGHKTMKCNLTFYENKLTLFMNGIKYNFVIEQKYELSHPPTFEQDLGGIFIKASIIDDDVPIVKHEAPMACSITQIFVKKGDTCKKGQSLMTIEAMKMMYEIKSQCDGVIQQLSGPIGTKITQGGLLCTIQRTGK